MARAVRLKVYRTPIGFHDAYVAAPSRKAALRAWGSDADLFARGVAEQVDDPELTSAALASPGTVIRRSRGTAAEQFAALPPDAPARKPPPDRAPAPDPKPRPKRTPKPRPRPSRATLDDAERAIAAEDEAHRTARAAIVEEERRLAQERRTLDETHEHEAARLEKRREAAQVRYDRALDTWRR